jgi:hypothetical protein
VKTAVKILSAVVAAQTAGCWFVGGACTMFTAAVFSLKFEKKT